MNLQTVELKAFVPARDFEQSKRFYADLGFAIPWSSDALAYLHAGACSFLLERHPRWAANAPFRMHLLVADVDAWWQHVTSQRLGERYGVHAEPPADRAWRIRDFVLADPSGVLWRIGTNLDTPDRD